MQQLTMTADRQVEWREVPEPVIEDDGRRWSARSRSRSAMPTSRSLASLPGPVALGHEFVAEVAEVGEEVGAVASATT